MTLGEFKAWLDGYLAAGGNDIAVIKEKLDDTREKIPHVLPRTTFRGYPIPAQTDTNPMWPYNTCTSEVN